MGESEKPVGQAGPGAGLSADDKLWGMLCHLAALAGFIIPFGNVIGPLVIWLIKKDTMPWVDTNGKAALNFQISIAIYAVASFILFFIIIGMVLLPAVFIFNLVCIILASVKANAGQV